MITQIFYKKCQNTPSPQAGEGGGEGEHIISTPTLILPHQRLCRNRGNGQKCHAELVSASNRIKYLRDPEPSSG